jgi:uncharacterized protein YkwD
MSGSSRALRLVGALVVVVAAALATGSALAAPARHDARSKQVVLTSLEHGVLADINAFRSAHHLAPLRVSVELTQAADQHSREMATDGYFAHHSANGGAFWKRIAGFYGAGNWRLWSVGENLLWSSPGVSPEEALQMWEQSPEHRKNLLTPQWREVGISAVHVAAAPGAFHGLGVTIVTADFGVRS